MKKTLVPMLAAGCSLLLATSGMAEDQMSGQSKQQEQQQSFSQQQEQQTQYSQQLSTPEMLSQANIQSQQGQDLGKVEQVLFDSQQGEVKFVLMKSKSGSMEIVPWDALKLQQQEPQQSQQGQQGQMTLVLQQQQQEKYSSPDMFKNAKLQDSQGRELGTVENTLIDAQEGKIAYVMVKSKSGPQAIVPFSALQKQQQQQEQQQQEQQQGQITFVVQGQAPELKEAPEGQIPNVIDRKQGEVIHQYYGVAPYWESGSQQEQQLQQDLEQDQFNRPDQQKKNEQREGKETRSIMD